MSDLIKATAELEVEYADNIVTATSTKNYSKIKNDNVGELISEVEIRKLVSLGYFDNQ